MPFQPVPNTAEVIVQGTNNGIPVQNTFYVLNSIPWVSEALDDLCAVVSDAVEEGMLSRLCTVWFGIGVFARDLTTEIGAVGSNTGLAGLTGASSGTPMSNNNSAAFKRTTGLAGRSARGRIYWMSMDIGFLSSNENILSGSFITAALGDLEAITDAITGEGYTNVIVSRYSNGAPRETALTLEQTGWENVTIRVASRRDRLPRI